MAEQTSEVPEVTKEHLAILARCVRTSAEQQALGRVMANLGALDALRQRIAELEGEVRHGASHFREVVQENTVLHKRIAELQVSAAARLDAADRLGEMVRGIGHRRPVPGETLSDTFPHGSACIGCRVQAALAAYDEARG